MVVWIFCWPVFERLELIEQYSSHNASLYSSHDSFHDSAHSSVPDIPLTQPSCPVHFRWSGSSSGAQQRSGAAASSSADLEAVQALVSLLSTTMGDAANAEALAALTAPASDPTTTVSPLPCNPLFSFRQVSVELTAYQCSLLNLHASCYPLCAPTWRFSEKVRP